MADAAALLAAVARLELVARRNVTSMLAGSYRTAVVGDGLEFHEARRYLPGDPVRHIDWKMTARTGTPYVRTYLEERRREVMLALDVSPSMYTGWGRRNKLETAVELAATLAVSAVDAGDRLGWLTFADRVLEEAPPAAGKVQLFRFLRTALEAVEAPPPRVSVSDPRAAIHAVQGLRGRRLVVFLVSDFVDQDVPDDLAYVTARHDLSLFHVWDPLEAETGGPVGWAARSPEGTPRVTAFRPGMGAAPAEVLATLRRAAARHRLGLASFSTADPLGRRLAAYFARRGARRLAG